MNEAVFISDLHLHPHQPEITEKFRKFIHWASEHTQSVYILGDFLHVWAGDDSANAWSDEIAHLLAGLSARGITVFFMVGNRDFLVGPTFLAQAHMQHLVDPTVIQLKNERVLLSHGDRYCTKDRSHQYFRLLTRNACFRRIFLCLPYRIRQCLVHQVRHYSQQNIRKELDKMQTVPAAMHHDVHCYDIKRIIHGHTHQPGLRDHQYAGIDWQEYTLSDWDENPSVLCYNKSKYYYHCF